GTRLHRRASQDGRQPVHANWYAGSAARAGASAAGVETGERIRWSGAGESCRGGWSDRADRTDSIRRSQIAYHCIPGCEDEIVLCSSGLRPQRQTGQRDKTKTIRDSFHDSVSTVPGHPLDILSGVMSQTASVWYGETDAAEPTGAISRATTFVTR